MADMKSVLGEPVVNVNGTKRKKNNCFLSIRRTVELRLMRPTNQFHYKTKFIVLPAVNGPLSSPNRTHKGLRTTSFAGSMQRVAKIELLILCLITFGPTTI